MHEESRRKLRALIVDDSETILDVMSHALSSSQSIEVIGSASTGAEAVTRSADLLPDIVIMDIEMPIMGGLEATRLIKRAHPGIVVVLVSGSANLLTASVSAGADGYISKPFSSDSLARRIMDEFANANTP